MHPCNLVLELLVSAVCNHLLLANPLLLGVNHFQPQIGAVQGLAQLVCQISKGVSGVVGDMLGSQVGS